MLQQKRCTGFAFKIGGNKLHEEYILLDLPLLTLNNTWKLYYGKISLEQKFSVDAVGTPNTACVQSVTTRFLLHHNHHHHHQRHHQANTAWVPPRLGATTRRPWVRKRQESTKLYSSLAHWWRCIKLVICTEQKIPNAKFSEVPRKKENYCYDFRSFNLNI